MKINNNQQEQLEMLIEESKKSAVLDDYRIPIKRTNSLGILKWYREQVQIINDSLDNIEELLEIKSICKEGCSNCCKHPIVIQDFEVKVINKYLENYSRSEINKLSKRVDHVLEELYSNNINDSKINTAGTEKEIYKVMQEYFSLNIPCIFLEDEKCSIYEIRPKNCWSYRAYFTAENCESSHDIPNSIKFNDWDTELIKMVYEVKPPKRKAKLHLLPIIIRELIDKHHK